jgi:hypothetical protein
MNRHSAWTSPLAGPAALLALAAVMPLAVAGEFAGTGSGAPGMVAGSTHDQVETIARCVDQAARQFCGAQPALPTPESNIAGTLPNPYVAAEPAPDRPAGSRILLPFLIDMPPPGR